MAEKRAAGGPSPSIAAGVHFVRGEDSSLVDAEVRSVVRSLCGPGDSPDLAVEDYRTGLCDVSAVIDACRTPPFFTDRRIIVLRDVGQLGSSDVASLVACIADLADTTAVVLVAGGGRTPASLTKAVNAAGGVLHDVSVPSGSKGRSVWLASHLSGGPVTLDASARAALARHLGEDLDRLEGLVRTLEAAYGTGARIGEGELEPFLGEAGGVPPWDLTDAIDRGDTGESLRLLRRLTVAGGRQAVAVMAILQRHFLEMLALDGSGIRDDAAAAAALNTPSTFRAGKLRRQAASLGGDAIARAVTLLADADQDLRGGTGWEPELVMEVLVARLSRLGSGRPATSAGQAGRRRSRGAVPGRSSR